MSTSPLQNIGLTPKQEAFARQFVGDLRIENGLIVASERDWETNKLYCWDYKYDIFITIRYDLYHFLGLNIDNPMLQALWEEMTKDLGLPTTFT